MQCRRITPVLVTALLLFVCGCSSIVSHTSRRMAAKNNVVVTVRPASTASLMSLSKEDRNDMLRDTQKVLQKRLASVRGVVDPNVELLDNNEFRFAIPDTQPSNVIIKRMLTSGNLEFYYLKDVQNNNNPYGKWKIDSPMSKKDAYIFTGPKGETIDSIKQPAELLSKVVMTSTNPPVLTGAQLLPNARADLDSANHAVVSIEFNDRGRDIFRDFTRMHVDDYLAVFYNGRLLTAPKINEPIPGGQAMISGFSTLLEAKETAEYLNAGPLPVPLQVVSVKHL